MKKTFVISLLIVIIINLVGCAVIPKPRDTADAQNSNIPSTDIAPSEGENTEIQSGMGSSPESDTDTEHNSSNLEQPIHIPMDKDFEIIYPYYKSLKWLNDESFAVCLRSKINSTLTRLIVYNTISSSVICSKDFKCENSNLVDMDSNADTLMIHVGNTEVKVALSDMVATHKELQGYINGTVFASSGWAAIPRDEITIISESEQLKLSRADGRKYALVEFCDWSPNGDFLFLAVLGNSEFNAGPGDVLESLYEVVDVKGNIVCSIPVTTGPQYNVCFQWNSNNMLDGYFEDTKNQTLTLMTYNMAGGEKTNIELNGYTAVPNCFGNFSDILQQQGEYENMIIYDKQTRSEKKFSNLGDGYQLSPNDKKILYVQENDIVVVNI